MIQPTIEGLQRYLKENNIDAEFQPSTNQLYFILMLHDREVPVFLRIISDGFLIQLLAFLPFQIKKDAVNDVSRLLHFLNKEIDAPGFGIDESLDLAFYRCMVPTINGEVDVALLNMYLNTLQKVCKDYMLNIEPVALGSITYEKIINNAKKQQ